MLNDAGKRKTNFSIEFILEKLEPKNRASENAKPSERDVTEVKRQNFDWLFYNRFCRDNRSVKNVGVAKAKRKLSRHARIPFTSAQIAVLEENYRQTPYLSSAQVKLLSEVLQLPDVRVKIWFQNRRARERKELGTNMQQRTNAREYNP